MRNVLIVIIALMPVGSSACFPLRNRLTSSQRGWIQEVENLRQSNYDDTSLPTFAVTKTNRAIVTAATRSRSLNDCPWDYRLEIELREAGVPFRYQPTHFSVWHPRYSDWGPFYYHGIKLESLKFSAGYKWIARERVRTYLQEQVQHQKHCIPSGERVLKYWTFQTTPLLVSFRTPPVPEVVYPNNVQIEIGTHRTGTIDDLKADDGRLYLVDSGFGFPTRTRWVATFSGFPAKLYNLGFEYQAYSIGDVFQSFQVYYPSLNRWIDLLDLEGWVESTVEREFTDWNFGDPHEFIDSAGNLRIRVTCEPGAAKFACGADLMKMTYNLDPLSTEDP
jgi:hypothetical protein